MAIQKLYIMYDSQNWRPFTPTLEKEISHRSSVFSTIQRRFHDSSLMGDSCPIQKNKGIDQADFKDFRKL